MSNDLLRHGLEFARAIDNHQYEMTDVGVYFPNQRVMVAGAFKHYAPNDGLGLVIDPNIVPAEGIAQILKSGINGTSWYIAPFTNNVTPGSSLTAATFTSTAGEFVTYNEANRVAWTIPTDPVSGSYTNSASPASFTIGAVGGGGQAIYGAGILSLATKSGTTGKLLAASKFSAARTLFQTDVLTIEYALNGTST